jgi:5-methylcytosine-specific restriction endonuclease McrA
LNNGPQQKQFIEKFDKIQQDLEIEISKQIVKPASKQYKKATISTDLKQKLWERYYGSQGVAKCFCCGEDDIKPLNFEAGHVVAESNRGPTILDNMRPICKGCNRRMATTNMKDWMAENYPKRTFT